MNINHMIALKSHESSFLRQIFYFDLNTLDNFPNNKHAETN